MDGIVEETAMEAAEGEEDAAMVVDQDEEGFFMIADESQTQDAEGCVEDENGDQWSDGEDPEYLRGFEVFLTDQDDWLDENGDMMTYEAVLDLETHGIERLGVIRDKIDSSFPPDGPAQLQVAQRVGFYFPRREARDLPGARMPHSVAVAHRLAGVPLDPGTEAELQRVERYVERMFEVKDDSESSEEPLSFEMRRQKILSEMPDEPGFPGGKRAVSLRPHGIELDENYTGDERFAGTIELQMGQNAEIVIEVGDRQFLVTVDSGAARTLAHPTTIHTLKYARGSRDWLGEPLRATNPKTCTPAFGPEHMAVGSVLLMSNFFGGLEYEYL